MFLQFIDERPIAEAHGYRPAAGKRRSHLGEFQSKPALARDATWGDGDRAARNEGLTYS